MKTTPRSPSRFTASSGCSAYLHARPRAVLVKRAARASVRVTALVLMALCAGAAAAADPSTLCSGPSTAVDVRVAFTPGTAVINDSKASRELERTGGKSAAFHQLGVTRAEIQRELHVQLDERDHSPCARPSVLLRLSMRPVVVELAHELNRDACLRAYVLEHEMQHVAIYNASAGRAALQLEREMRARLSYRRLHGNSDKALDELQNRIDTQWLPRLDALVSEADADQDALDVDQEHQAYRACNGAMAQLLQTLK